MAPDASERAALQEHAGAYAVTIVYAKFLDIKNRSCLHSVFTRFLKIFTETIIPLIQIKKQDTSLRKSPK